MDNKYIKFCSVCNETKQNMDWCKNENYIEYSKGYHFVFVPNPGIEICPSCKKGKLTDSILTFEEFEIIDKGSDSNRQVLEAMLSLKEKDPIEYQLKLNQFKLQQDQKESIKKQQREASVPKCPHCQSTNIKKIDVVDRAASILGLGLFSKKINKSFQCKSCKYTW